MSSIRLPRHVRLATVSQGLFMGFMGDPTDAARVVVGCDHPPLSYVEPIAIALLAAWTRSARTAGREVVLDDSLKSPVAYQSGLLAALAGRDAGGTTLGRYLRLSDTQNLDSSTIDLAESAIPVQHPAARAVANYCLSELARNVFDHARVTAQGAACALSYDSKSRRVRLAVADAGRGIPATIRDHYHGDLDDRESLMLALEPEFSGDSARDDENRGVGLYFARRLALAANGAFTVITGDLVARASAKNPDSLAPAIERLSWSWEGTAVAITFVAAEAAYEGPMAAIRDEIEGRGPRYSDIAFFSGQPADSDWPVVTVVPDKGALAINRDRAAAIAREQILPLLRDGNNVAIQLRGVGHATQAFCHALTMPLLRYGGEPVLSRLRFLGCAAAVKGPIRFAISHGLDTSLGTDPSTAE